MPRLRMIKEVIDGYGYASFTIPMTEILWHLASVARFCPLLLNDLRHPRIPAQMPWSTFAGSLGRPRDALAQARRRPGQSPIRINGSP
jgi:hypothetical protein